MITETDSQMVFEVREARCGGSHPALGESSWIDGAIGLLVHLLPRPIRVAIQKDGAYLTIVTKGALRKREVRVQASELRRILVWEAATGTSTIDIETNRSDLPFVRLGAGIDPCDVNPILAKLKCVLALDIEKRSEVG